MLRFGFNNAPEVEGVQFSDQFMNLSVFNYTSRYTAVIIRGISVLLVRDSEYKYTSPT